ncbi:MAG: protein rhiA [Okeania sp. SIO2B3]|nr:protein rhiA [Okeania sp. SIO2B3]
MGAIITYSGANVASAPGATSLDTATGQKYSLTLVNNSGTPWTFYVYQKMPQPVANVFSLAWFASPFVIVDGAQITFTWEIVYNFVWSATGMLIPGVNFQASQAIEANLSDANTTTFDVTPGPSFTPPVKGLPSGSLVIKDQSNVPNNTYSVGIGMSGTGTFVAQAGPNLTHTFTPTPSYWVAAGNQVTVGTVLDITTVTLTKEAKFPVNVYSLKGTLGPDNDWTFVNA